MPATQIKPEVMLAISQASIIDGVVRLEGQLDRKLYLKVNEVLTALGGKWNRKAQGHTFPGVDDISERIEGVVSTGCFLDPKKHFNFFETPPSLAHHLMDRVRRIYAGHPRTLFRILEPSAGRGALMKTLLEEISPIEIDYFEAMHENRVYLKTEFPEANYLGSDFMDPPIDDFSGYNSIVMNPPFSGQQDIDHVDRALDILEAAVERKPRILVAVMSGGTMFRENRKAVAFRERVEKLGGDWTENPPGSFSVSGTDVQTVTLEVSL